MESAHGKEQGAVPKSYVAPRSRAEKQSNSTRSTPVPAYEVVATIFTAYRLKIDPHWTAVSEWTGYEAMRHRLSRIEQI